MTRQLSLYLDLLRFLAALAVYLFHAQHFAKARFPLVGNLGNEAVIVFFVLSGLLITYSGVREASLGGFVQARLARLWSVCLPALLLTLVADLTGQYLSLSSYQPMQPFGMFKWAAAIGANAIFLNQIWNLNIYPGTNGPFWSMSYEFWYYMLFAALWYFKGAPRLCAVALVALVTGPSILIAFPIWLFGAALYATVIRKPRTDAIRGILYWGGSFAIALACSYEGLNNILRALFTQTATEARWAVNFWPFSYIVGLLVALNIQGFSLLGERVLPALEKCKGPIAWGASISFGLYLFHYPLMYLTRAVLHEMGIVSGPGFVIAIYAIPFVCAASFATLCEKHKWVYTRVIRSVTNFAMRPRTLS